MTIVPCNKALPDGIANLIGSKLCEAASSGVHDFKVEKPLTTLIEKGFIPDGFHMADSVEFEWCDSLMKAVCRKVKSSTPVQSLLPSGKPLKAGDLFVHKYYTSNLLSEECVRSVFSQHAIPMHVALGLLLTTDPAKPSTKSPLSSTVENYVLIEMLDVADNVSKPMLLRVLYNPLGHDNRWLLFKPTTSVPPHKTIVFCGGH